MTETGTVAWFDLARQFGFVALSSGYSDAFLHMSVRVRVEEDRGKQRVAEVLEVDTSTARAGENEAIRRKPKP